jgi:hypothetical protein
MKKIIFLLLPVVALCAACLIAYIVGPALAVGAAIIKGGGLITNAFGIPHWVGLLLTCSLLPTGVIWAVKSFSPKYRKWVAIAFASFALIYALVAAALSNQNLLAAAHGTAMSIQQKLMPVKAVDPSSQPQWFSPAGTPLLFFVHSTNGWAFYQAYPGAHDPITGTELQPVTPSAREQWQAEQTRGQAVEIARAEETARLALEAQRQQLQSVQDALRAEKVARLQDQGVFIRRLIKKVNDKKTELTVAETNLPDLPLQLVSAAHQKLTDANTTLAGAMTNGTTLSVTAAQDEVQAAISSVDQAETEIHAASAARERDKLAVLDVVATKSALEIKEQQNTAELKKLKDERHQSELAAQSAAIGNEHQQDDANISNDLFHQPAPVALNHHIVANTQYGYWIIDGRGQEFGPVSIAQLQQWVAERRCNRNTPVFQEGWQEWKLLGNILPCPAPVVFYYHQYYRQPSYFVQIWH